jgi:hypothetical protein
MVLLDDDRLAVMMMVVVMMVDHHDRVGIGWGRIRDHQPEGSESGKSKNKFSHSGSSGWVFSSATIILRNRMRSAESSEQMFRLAGCNAFMLRDWHDCARDLIFAARLAAEEQRL